jgi:hypothetical protein
MVRHEITAKQTSAYPVSGGSILPIGVVKRKNSHFQPSATAAEAKLADGLSLRQNNP